MTVAVATRVRYAYTLGCLWGYAASPRPPGLEGEHPGANRPVDVAVGREGRVYWISRHEMLEPRLYYDAKARVTVSDHEDRYVREFAHFVGYDAEGDGHLKWPTSIAVDGAERVYVTDERRQDVQVFDREGNFLRKWGGAGSGDGDFDRPYGVEIDREGNVLIADCLNHRIQRFTPEGRYLGQWGSHGTAPGQFNGPWGIGVDCEGRILVADWRNARVQRFTHEGRYLDSFTDVALDRPAGVAADSDGFVYVSDHRAHTVFVFDPSRRLAQTLVGDSVLSRSAAAVLETRTQFLDQRIGLPDRMPEHEKRFLAPMGISVDERDRVLIADSGRHRIQVYARD